MNNKGVLIMNNVSWFLYLSDVMYSLSQLSGVFVYAGSFLLLGIFICHNIYEQDISYDAQGNSVYTNRYFARHISKHGYWLVPLYILSILFLTLSPSRETIYMIAASQVGEQIIQLEEMKDIGGEAGGLAKDAIDLLRQQIQEQLTEKTVETD